MSLDVRSEADYGFQNRHLVSSPVLEYLKAEKSPKDFKEDDDHEQIWVQQYCSSHKILLVGEGDFSFSASLALAFASASNMIATSLDSTGTYLYMHVRVRRL